jgi:hypothetical protein
MITAYVILVNNVTIHIYTYDYIRMDVTVLY